MTRDISIIIPTLNEQDRILDCLVKLSAWQPREIIVVDNGSTDLTVYAVNRWIRAHVLNCKLRLLELPKPGKGAAVRTGMLAAKSNFIYMADADLSTPACAIADFYMCMKIYKADVAIGNRRHRKSKVTQSLRRRLSGEIFHLMTNLLLPDIHDTQCGFKMFTRLAAQAIFANLQLDGLAFDVEVLLEAKRLGCSIAQIPITWTENKNSRIRPVRDGIRMAMDLWSLTRRYRGVIGSAWLRPSMPL